MTNQNEAPLRLLKLPEVLRRTGLSRSAVYEKIKRQELKRPVPLGGRAVGFVESEVEAWVTQRIAARDALAVQQSLAIAGVR
jgi:prophage regulatory protein